MGVAEEMNVTLEERIRNRNNWFFWLIICAVVLGIAAFIIFGDAVRLLEEITLAGMVSIGLAFFAIGLSVGFYLKTNEISATFYDNTYKFTQEVSEILGRIEERFGGVGERLRHMDEG
jgi:predicted PurR-regulated permease PerM